MQPQVTMNDLLANQLGDTVLLVVDKRRQASVDKPRVGAEHVPTYPLLFNNLERNADETHYRNHSP